MGKKKNWFPFRWTPTSWALKGPPRDEAQAYYELDGQDLAERLAEIRLSGVELERALLDIRLRYHQIGARDYDLQVLKIEGRDTDEERLAVALKHDEITQYDYDVAVIGLRHRKGTPAAKAALIEVDRKHGRIDDYDADLRLAELKASGDELQRAILEIDHLHGKIDDYTFESKKLEHELEGKERDLALLDLKLKNQMIDQTEYEKQVANVKEEPWVSVVESGFEPDKGLNGVYFKFDWNDLWIEYLRMNGYTGLTEEAVVDAWFTDVCRAQGLAVSNQPFDVLTGGR